jgi:non-specific serine/threonine protein kinase
MIGRTLGRYTIMAKLGQGGMATVWRAEDALLRRTVALKILADNLVGTPAAEHRFMREARAASALDHPGAVAVYDAGKAGGQMYIAFACVDGETVSDLAARAPYENDAAIALGLAVADTLAHAHAKGIVHRDITGRNVMVDREGRVFVLDFGLAWIAGTVRLTSTHSTLGTYAYIAPEVAAGSAADERSDLYGLGVVLYEALTGTLPFHGDNPGAILYAVMHARPEPPTRRRPGVGDGIERVVLRLLEKEPDRRYRNAAELTADLRSLGAGTPAASPTVREPHAESGSPDVTRVAPASEPRIPDVIYLAVLPFEDSGTGTETESGREVFAEGLAGALGAALGHHAGVHLVPVPARVPDLPVDDLEGLARALGANLILRGSVRRSGFHLRVSYRLLNPYQRLQVAGDTIDGSVVELFDVEDRLVTSVLGALGLEPASAAPRRRSTRDPAAHERFVQAIGYLQHFENEAHVDAALGLLERLAESDPESAPIRAATGRACLFKYRLTAERSWVARAAVACHAAIERDPISPDVLLTLGDLGVSTGQYRDAIDHYRRALELRPGAHDAMIGMARAYEGLGQYAEAERCCRDAIALRPGYWAGHEELGLLFSRQGRFEEALEPWRQMVALAPDNYRGHRHLGMAYFNLGRCEEALQTSRKSIDLHPNAPAYSNVGTILFYYLGRYAEAAQAFEKARDLRPAEPLLWGNFGSACLWVPGRRQEAEAALCHAIALVRDRLERNPHETRDWLRLASWQANLGRHAEANEALARGLGPGGDDVTILVQAGIICEQGGDRGGAMRYLREAVRKGYEVDLLARDPYLAALRTEPDFAELSKESPSTRERPESPAAKHPSPKEDGREDPQGP